MTITTPAIKLRYNFQTLQEPPEEPGFKFRPLENTQSSIDSRIVKGRQRKLQSMLNKHRNKPLSSNLSPVLQSLKKENLKDFKVVGSRAATDKLETNFNFIAKSKVNTPFSGNSRTSPKSIPKAGEATGTEKLQHNSPISTKRMSESGLGSDKDPISSFLLEPTITDTNYFIKVPQPMNIIQGMITPVYYRSKDKQELEKKTLLKVLEKAKREELDRKDPLRSLNDDLQIAASRADEKLQKFHRRSKTRQSPVSFNSYLDQLKKSKELKKELAMQKRNGSSLLRMKNQGTKPQMIQTQQQQQLQNGQAQEQENVPSFPYKETLLLFEQKRDSIPKKAVESEQVELKAPQQVIEPKVKVTEKTVSFEPRELENRQGLQTFDKRKKQSISGFENYSDAATLKLEASERITGWQASSFGEDQSRKLN